MVALLPTHQASDLISGIQDYLTTTFALSDGDAQTAIREFLADPHNGMFKGPYIRLRLPFENAPDGWEDSLRHHVGEFSPYGHQAKAYARLSSLGTGQERFRRPEPTLVTTGTGSGKTEAFLHPILDHVMRAQSAGIRGIKALILYPMNALANDQASRLAKLLSRDPRLAGVRAAIYTGQEESKRTRVSEKGLINDRATIRDQVPDILLTNYKMLDQLLLRHEDAKLWSESATSLQYLVLDEFHTYDGAQGTDVAMLLRRLGITLKSYWSDTTLAKVEYFSADAWQRPLGILTPVATSATLGGGDGGAEMLKFAETIFGEKFTPDALITESRLDFETWKASGSATSAVPRPVEELPDVIDQTNSLLEAQPGHDVALEIVLDALFEIAPDPNPEALLDALRHHELTRQLVELTESAADILDLAQRVFPEMTTHADQLRAAEFLSHVLALYSHVRVETGRAAITVETHLWVRELSRIDAKVDTALEFRWGDDPVEEADEPSEDEAPPTYLPAIYCRHCGRYGWGALLAPNESDIITDPSEIRQAAVAQDSQFRAMLDAKWEADDASSVQRHYRETKKIGLRYFHRQHLKLSIPPPEDDDPDLHRGLIIPVLCLDGENAAEQSRDDVCPACFAEDAIRFVGSAISTLTSVAVSTVFGDQQLNNAEKKALIFTDSVQDAAHRAGFIQARSRTFTLRTQLRSGFDDTGHTIMTLPQLVDQVMHAADQTGEKSARFQLIPPDLVERQGFAAYWQTDATALQQSRAARNVRRRLLFDAGLELGLNARLGRTLELTGSVVVEADTGSASRLLSAARNAWDSSLHVLPDIGLPTEQRYLHWVRGILIRMRLRGGIYHDWLQRYIENDGKRYWIWGGRPREQGMPAFPHGRSAPAFPVVGSTSADSGLDAVGSRTSWYTNWTQRTLGVTADDAQILARKLFEHLAANDTLMTISLKTGGTAFALSPDQVLLAVPTDDELHAGQAAVQCSVCGTLSYGTQTVVEQMLNAPCLRQTCPGEQRPAVVDSQNYYRRLYASTEGKRVVAKEHTSVLSDKDRLVHEQGFKRSDQQPDDPNVLVATPTLEMGIDIGDLSFVMLASLPTSVASYIQRVGRAGRLTGNSLAIAFVRGRGQHLPKLNDPLSVINGDVRPPRTYLEAEEILRRQFAAFLGDRMARDADAIHPKRTNAVMSSIEEHTYLGQLLAQAQDNGRELVDEFLAAFGELVTLTGRDNLRHWVATEMGNILAQASQDWLAQRESLRHRITDVDRAVDELTTHFEQVKHDYSNDSEHAKVKDAERDLKTATAQRKRLGRELAKLSDDWWISVLEHYGIFPNYTLIGEPVVLNVGVSWRNEDTQQFEAETRELERTAAVAIQELAPGAKFYAYGMEIDVDAVDMGPQQRDLQYWQLCPACGWINSVHRAGTLKGYTGQVATCPRCGQDGIHDSGQIFTALELNRVSAEIRRDESAITDNVDERQRTRFTVLSVADVEPQGIDTSWFVQQNGFGVEYLRRTTVTNLNFGRTAQRSPDRFVAGQRLSNAPLFQVCSYCGQLNQPHRARQEDNHRFWCRDRKSGTPDHQELLLAHRLETQGVKLHLPVQAAFMDEFVTPTLLAAIQLGLMEYLGGTTGQVRAFGLPTPDDSHATTLLIHDTVPGGTGYLAAFRKSDNVFAILAAAWRIVRDCQCRHENRRACHRCLLPYAPYREEDYVSRVVAERLLAELLNIAPDQDTVEENSWIVQDQPIEIVSDESVLEVQFRSALKERLATVNARQRVVPTSRGEELVFQLPGQRFEWRLRPQQDMDGTRPDFLLIPGDVNLPRLAIYTDGYSYHATRAHNRVADDAMKRHALRHLGDAIPWAVTYEDLRAFDPASEETPEYSGQPNEWIDQNALDTFQQQYNFERSIIGALPLGNMELLWAWIENPKLTDWQKFANQAPGLAVHGTVAMGPIDIAQVPPVHLSGEAANEHLRLEDPSSLSWTRHKNHVTLLAGGEMTQSNTVPRSILVLADDPEAIESADYQESWQQWLTWSNLLSFSSTPEHSLIATSSSIDALWQQMYPSADPVHSMNAVDVGHSTIPDAWQEIFEDTGEDEHDFFHELISHDVPVPELGDELDGVMLQIMWPEHNVAVVYESEDLAPVESTGWTAILSNDLDGVLTALNVAN